MRFDSRSSASLTLSTSVTSRSTTRSMTLRMRWISPYGACFCQYERTRSRRLCALPTYRTSPRASFSRYTPGRSGSRLSVAASSGVTAPMLGQRTVQRGRLVTRPTASAGSALHRGRSSAGAALHLGRQRLRAPELQPEAVAVESVDHGVDGVAGRGPGGGVDGCVPSPAAVRHDRRDGGATATRDEDEADVTGRARLAIHGEAHLHRQRSAAIGREGAA